MQHNKEIYYEDSLLQKTLLMGKLAFANKLRRYVLTEYSELQIAVSGKRPEKITANTPQCSVVSGNNI